MAKLRSYSQGKAVSRNMVVVAVSAISLIAVTALVVGIQSFGWLNPKASALTPRITRRLVDNFKGGTPLDVNVWTTAKVSDSATLKNQIGINATASNNLRFDLPAMTATDVKPSQAVLTKNGAIETRGDFTFIAQMYRPTITGAGTGRIGIRFASTGGDNDEIAGIFWRSAANEKEGQLVFYVNDATGKRLVTETTTGNFNPATAMVRLDRKDNSYVAYYKVNSFDLTADASWIALGRCVDTVSAATRKPCNTGLGKAGSLAVVAYNGDTDKKYPKVGAPIDTLIARWEDSTYTPPAATGFVDAFNNNVIAKSWKYSLKAGATLSETSGDRLVATIPNTSATKTVANAFISRTQPIVGVEKDFAYSVIVYKPEVTGDGEGVFAMSFNSATRNDKENAALRWIVRREKQKITIKGKLTNPRVEETSTLVFTVVDRSGGNVGTTQSVILTTPELKAGVLKLRLSRATTDGGNKTTYRAWYSVGTDLDAVWKPVGVAADEVLGEDGSFSLGISNRGAVVSGAAQYPKVVVRIDSASASVAQ